MVRRSLSAALAVTVRDRPSLTTLRRLGLDPVLAADPVLTLPVEPVAPDRLVVALRRSVPRPEDRQPGCFLRAAVKALIPAPIGCRPWPPPWTGPPQPLDWYHGSSPCSGPVTIFSTSKWRHDVHPERADGTRPRRRHGRDRPRRGSGGDALPRQVAALAAGRPSVLIGYSPKVAALAAEAAPATSLLPNDPAAFGLLAGAVEAAGGAATG